MRKDATPRPVGQSRKLLLMAASSLALAWLLFGQSTFAKWWIIDDHEIMWIVGTNQRLPLSEYWPRLLQTEIGQAGSYPRFRPAYYALRLLEAAVWGKQPAAWYGFRVFTAALFAFCAWWALSRHIGLLPAGLLTLNIMTFGFWSDVVGRLGPSEAHAAMGIALLVLGYALVEGNPNSRAGWLLLLVGTLLATGSKENLLVLLVPVGFVSVRAISRDRSAVAPWLAGGISLGWCAWIAGAVGLGLARSGGDVYHNSVSWADRLPAVLAQAGRPLPILLMLLVMAFLILAALQKLSRAAAAPVSLAAAWSVLSLLAVYLSQLYFYDGDWPRGNRYDFPGILVLPLALGIIVWYMQALLRLDSGSRWLHSVVPVAAILLAMATGIANVRNIASIRGASQETVRKTTRFTATVRELALMARGSPKLAIVIQTNDPWDYEPVISYTRFLEADGIANNTFLLWLGDARQASPTFEAHLSAELAGISRDGLTGYYLPLRLLDRVDKDCILVTLSAAQGAWPCKQLIDGDWNGY